MDGNMVRVVTNTFIKQFIWGKQITNSSSPKQIF